MNDVNDENDENDENDVNHCERNRTDILLFAYLKYCG